MEAIFPIVSNEAIFSASIFTRFPMEAAFPEFLKEAIFSGIH